MIGLRIGLHPAGHRPERAPDDPHQLHDRVRRALRGQRRHLGIEETSVSGVMPGPGHHHHRHPVDRAMHPRRISFQVNRNRAQIHDLPTVRTLRAVTETCRLLTGPAPGPSTGPRPHGL